MMKTKKYSWKKFSVDLKKGVEFLGSMKHEEATDERVECMVERALESKGHTNLIWIYGISPLYCKKLNEYGMYTGWKVLRLEGRCYLLESQIVEIVHQDRKEYYRIGVNL